MEEKCGDRGGRQTVIMEVKVESCVEDHSKAVDGGDCQILKMSAKLLTKTPFLGMCG